MAGNRTKIGGLAAIGILLILFSSQATAHDEDTFTEAEELIKQKIPCEELTDSQLEILGDYYMEQMHPGEAHETMDQMMGGEGSESLRLTHISIAKSFYCGEHEYMSGSMMDTMMGRNQGGLANMMCGTGMMGTSGWFLTGFLWLIWIAIVAFVVGIMLWWAYKLINKVGKKRRE